MATTTTQTVEAQIPSPTLHLNPQETGVSQGPVSDLGTLEHPDSPGAESTISAPTQGAFSPRQSQQLDPSHAVSGSFSRARSISNLSPPQEQAEWARGTDTTRSRSNSATRYYTHARERSGTVNSTNEHNGKPSQDNTYYQPPTSDIQASRGFHSPTPSQQYAGLGGTMGSPPPGPAPAYNSNQQASAYPPQPQMQHPYQPDHLTANASQGQNPNDLTMVTPLEHLGNDPATVDCPRCQTATRTTTTKEAGDAVTLWAVVLCCLTGAICAWVPCVIKDCKDTVHRCSQCQLLLATVTSSGAVRVAQGVNKPVHSQFAQQPSMAQHDSYNKPPDQWQHRDAGPAPAYMANWNNEQQQQRGLEAQRPQQTPSVPVEMEASAVEPVELPAAAGPGWLGEANTRTDSASGPDMHMGGGGGSLSRREGQSSGDAVREGRGVEERTS